MTAAAGQQRNEDQATHRAEIDRLTSELQAARTELATTRAAAEHTRAEHAADRETAAEQRGELAAARRALTDERDRHAAELAELRDRHAAELRASTPGRPASAGTDPPDLTRPTYEGEVKSWFWVMLGVFGRLGGLWMPSRSS